MVTLRTGGVAATLLVLAVLAGCASPGGVPAPIEERSGQGAAAKGAAPATGTAVAAAPAVRAIPLPNTPAPEALALAEPLPELESLAPPPAEAVAGTLAATAPARAPVTRLVPSSSAVRSLLDSARSAGDAGDWERAQATLERALKLAPRDAAAWLQMAEVHFRRGAIDQSHEFAQRALVLAGPAGADDPGIWSLMADVEMARGNLDAAAEARRRATPGP